MLNRIRNMIAQLTKKFNMGVGITNEDKLDFYRKINLTDSYINLFQINIGVTSTSILHHIRFIENIRDKSISDIELFKHDKFYMRASDWYVDRVARVINDYTEPNERLKSSSIMLHRYVMELYDSRTDENFTEVSERIYLLNNLIFTNKNILKKLNIP